MIMFALGAAMAVAGFGGAYITRPQKAEPKDKLRICFERARLYLKSKADDVWVYHYPNVSGHEEFEEYEEYSFSLPIGLDPERVFKYYWVFKQGFGEEIDIEGDASEFRLKIFRHPIAQFDYRLEDIPVDGLRLPIVAGRTREGWEVYDMVQHPHLLVAGETGSGKSTELRSILSTLIKTKSTDDLHLYLADLKRSEFHLFRHSPHVQELVISTKEILSMLQRLRMELEVRGDMLNDAEVAHIDDLPNKPPYILLCVDEFALLKNDKKALEILEEISSIGRALGVFLILSTQRPDHKVMDGKLKQNLTVRMAFRHEDAINSRITLGSSGAESIKASEQGLMLFKLDGIKRVQSPYLGLEEAKALLSEGE